MKHTNYLPFLGLLCTICFACERPEVDNTDNNYPIELSVMMDEDDVVNLSWTATNVSTFDNYTILRSTDSIFDDLSSFFIAGNTIANISEYDESSFIDENIPFAEKLYYKVLANIGNRILLSPTVRLDNDVTVLDFSLGEFHFDKENQLGYFYVSNSGLVYQYDFINDNFPSNPQNPSVRPQRFYSGNYGGGEVYFIDGTSTLSIYSKEPFQYNTSLVSAGSTYDDIYSVVYQNGLLFLTIDDWSSPLRIYDRASQSLVGSQTYSNSSSEHLLVPLPVGNNKFMIASQRNLLYYDFDGVGNVTSQSDFPIPYYNLLDKPQVSPDGQYIVAFENGMIFQTNPIQQVGTVVSAGTGYFSSMIFSDDGNRLFVVPNISPEVQEYSFPDLQLVKSHQMPFSVRELCTAGNKLYALGLVFINNRTATAIETITIE